MSSITLAQLAEIVPDFRVLAVTFSQNEYRFHLKTHPAEFGLTAFRARLFGARHAVQSTAQMGFRQLVADMGEEARRQPHIVTATLCPEYVVNSSLKPNLYAPNHRHDFDAKILAASSELFVTAAGTGWEAKAGGDASSTRDRVGFRLSACLTWLGSRCQSTGSPICQSGGSTVRSRAIAPLVPVTRIGEPSRIASRKTPATTTSGSRFPRNCRNRYEYSPRSVG